MGLLGAVFDTMQNWADNNLTRVAGFRERICTIDLGDGEGGMNLDMPPERIAPLIARGRIAGRNLSSVRTGDLEDTGIDPENEAAQRQWDRHRWARCRMAGAGVHRLVEEVRSVYEEPATQATPSYSDLGAETIGSDSPFPYSRDWNRSRNDDVAMWQRSSCRAGSNLPGSAVVRPAWVSVSVRAPIRCRWSPHPRRHPRHQRTDRDCIRPPPAGHYR